MDSEMAFKVFLSHSTDPNEQAIVWRLQTLAVAHGISLFVAPEFAPPLRRGPLMLSERVAEAIDSADCVLAIITSATGPAVEKELDYALAKKKLIIPIVEQGVHDEAFVKKLNPVFYFSRLDDPGKVETQVIEFLKRQKVAKENLQAVGALVAIGLGLLLLSELSRG